MTSSIDLNQIKTWRDAKSAGVPAFKIMSDGVIKAYRDESGTRRFSLTASSDDTDLVGDVMTAAALKRMETAAPGTTMFLNHSYSVPEDVFGAVESARVRAKTLKSAETSSDTTMLCLEYEGVVEENNDRAVKVHDMMMAGRVKLGASVSVLVTDKTAARDGRRLINDVYYLECSVVGMPCNRQSWVESANKALNLDIISAGTSADDPGVFTHNTSRKISARTNQEDQATIQQIHDYAMQLGAVCNDVEECEIESEDEEVSARSASLIAPSSERMELVNKVASLISEVESLNRELETAKQELKAWEACSPVVQAALRMAGREHMPRAGVGVRQGNI